MWGGRLGGVVVETCGECGFDGAEWNRTDTLKTLVHAGDLLRDWTAIVPDDLVAERPAPDVWSVNEYAHHIAQVLRIMHVTVSAARSHPGVDLGARTPPPEPGPHRRHDRLERIAVVHRDAVALVETLRGFTDVDWAATALIDGVPHDVEWAARHAVHDLWHHLIDVADLSVRLGAALPTGTGRLERINVSRGGVPKRAVDTAEVGRRGLVGDVQKTRVHHGRPWQAVCLWSSEVIDALAADGHPVSPGAAGENLTVSGLDWSSLHAGAVVRIGELVCQLSAPADPCSKIAHCFGDRDSGRIGVDRDPALTRWYASVLRPATIATGDAVHLGPLDA